MPKPKRTNSGNESDSDDGGFLTRFHHLPTVNAAQEPPRIINVRVPNTYSSSYILTSSRTVIIVSMIFALLESLLCGLGILSLSENFDSEMQIIASVVFVIFLAAEGSRIYLLSRWWGVHPRCDIEPNRAYGETIKCFLISSLIITCIICPIFLLVFVFFIVYGIASMHGGDLPGGLLLFVLVAGFDLLLFVPCFACPTVICASCFWKRVVRRHDRGMEYLRQNQS